MNIKVIAFDADDTLWVNEPYFRQTEESFCELLGNYLSLRDLERELLRIEIANLPLYGYGIKGFVLSMVETALRVSNNTITVDVIEQLLMIGNSLKSDVMPVLNVGGYAIHVPYHITWAHEQIEHTIDNERFKSVENIKEVLEFV